MKDETLRKVIDTLEEGVNTRKIVNELVKNLDYPYRSPYILGYLYEIEDKNTVEISKELECSVSSMVRWLYKYDIRESSSYKEDECDFCGSEFSFKKSNSSRNNFCSRECKQEWESVNWKGENNPNYKGKKEVICEECGEEYKVIPAIIDKSRFCSKECKNNAHSKEISGENHPFYGGRDDISGNNHYLWKEKIERKCSFCGETLKLNEYYSKLVKNTFCNDTCRKKWRKENMKGKNHPAWKGGTSSDEYGSEWLTQRSKTLERDNYRCRICGKDDMGEREPQVHHINPNLDDNGYKDNSLENLLTLCIECHLRTENNNWLPKYI